MPSQPRKIALPLGLFFLLILIISINAQLELPAPTGPYSVGRTILRWVDTSRPEVLTANPDDLREIVALIWYPAELGTGMKAGYFPDLASVSQALMQSGEVTQWQVTALRFVRLESSFDAIPLKSKNPFPVVIFSPGNGTNVEFYASLASEIASYGYLVVGVNHPYDVAAVELPDGKIAPYDKEQWSLQPEGHQEYTAKRIKVRTRDVLFVLDQLEDLNSSGPFAGTMNLKAVAVAGHSLGGITASEVCKADERLKACLNFDGLQKGGPFSMEESAIPPKQPFLFLTKESQLNSKAIERFASMPESYWVVVHGASHQSFTDGPLLQPSLLPGPDQADRLMGLIQQYTLAFLDETLKGQPSNLLSKAVDGKEVSVRVFASHQNP